MKELFEKAAGMYVEAFCKKQECQLEFWVADKIGEIGCFGDDFFDLSDIRFEWSNYNTEQRPSGVDYCINFENYLKGQKY